MQTDLAAIESIKQIKEQLKASNQIHTETKVPYARQPGMGAMFSHDQGVPQRPIIPQPIQLMQMQVALQECIMSLQHVYVQRHAIYSALSQRNDMVAQMPQLDGSKFEIRGKEALDQAFVKSSS